MLCLIWQCLIRMPAKTTLCLTVNVNNCTNDANSLQNHITKMKQTKINKTKMKNTKIEKTKMKTRSKKGHVDVLTPLYRALAKMKMGHKTKTKKTNTKKTKVRKGHVDALTPLYRARASL